MSFGMLEVCRIVSSHCDDGISSFIEPDDSIDLYIDFLDVFPDWINDEYLLELIDNVFHRKKGIESKSEEQ